MNGGRARASGSVGIRIQGKLGIFSLGLERIGEEADWKMINGREWYEEKRSQNWTDRPGSPVAPNQ